LPFKCATRFGIWAYLAVFAATAAGCVGIQSSGRPLVWAYLAVFVSRGQLAVAAVVIVAAIGNRIGGLAGSRMRGRRGRQVLEHPGPALKMGKKAAAGRGAGLQEAGTRRGVLHAFGGVGRREREAQLIRDLGTPSPVPR
jgi:hypothetical protein